MKQTVNKDNEQHPSSLDEDTDIGEKEPIYRRRNPYLIFLKAIEDEDFEDEPEVTNDLTEFHIRRPWLSPDKYAKDPLSRRNEESAKYFCH